MSPQRIKRQEDLKRLFAQAAQQGWERVDLSQHKLDALPPEVGEAVPLKSLVLSGNRLLELPPEIGRLENLERLYLGGNRLLELPAEIGRLKRLQRLYLGNNQLHALPAALGELESLERLGLAHNELTELPEEIGRLTQLDRIILGGNRLERLPEALCALTRLKYLDLSGNRLETLPAGLAELPHLEKVVIQGNRPLAARGYFIPELTPSVLKLFLDSQAKRDNLIIRSLEFPPDLYQSGITVLNYFGTLVQQKYPDEPITVRIEQEGSKITMVVETPEGQREVIEQCLEEYGLVVTGQRPPEALLEDRLQLVQLKNKLSIAQMEIEFHRELRQVEQSISREREADLEAQLAERNRVLADVFVAQHAGSGNPSPSAPPRAGRELLTVMFLDLAGSSQLDPDARGGQIQLLQSLGQRLLERCRGRYVNTWGDALVAAFDDPNAALECACKLLQHLEVEGIAARVGMHYGTVQVQHNPVRGAPDLEGDTLSYASRLEPMARQGEVLVSDTLFLHPDLDKRRFQFAPQQRTLKKPLWEHPAGAALRCYAVEMDDSPALASPDPPTGSGG